MLLKFDENAVSYDKFDGRGWEQRGKGCCAYFILIKLEKFSQVTVFRHKPGTGAPSAWLNDMQSYYANGVGRRGEMRGISSAKKFPRMLNSIC